MHIYVHCSSACECWTFEREYTAIVVHPNSIEKYSLSASVIALSWNTWHVHCLEMGCFSAKPGKENDEERSRREANKRIEKQLQKDKQTYRATHRLLLLGNHFLWKCLLLSMGTHTETDAAKVRAPVLYRLLNDVIAYVLGASYSMSRCSWPSRVHSVL